MPATWLTDNGLALPGAAWQRRRRVFVLLGFPLVLLAAVYVAACAPIVLRSFLRKKPTVWRAGGCALAGSALFFVSTNTAVWLLGTGYTPDASGLLASLSAGVPFWRNALLGDLMFSTLLFGAWATAGQMIPTYRDLRRGGRLLPDGVSSN